LYLLYDQLVMTYAVVELLLHATEHLLRFMDLTVFLPSVILGAQVLHWCVVYLSDIQEVRPQFLQLTARDAHQCPINGRHGIEERYPWNSSDALQNKTVNCKNVQPQIVNVGGSK
jgi:hypothetical protein